jgi:beta-lysine 5,6-aminomutase alpha subunit
MPPTKHKTGDVFQSHVHDAMFSLVGVTTHQSIELLGMFSEAIHNPLLMDRYLSLKATRYVFNAAKHLGDELEVKRDGILEKRARKVLGDAHALLGEVERESIWTALARGVFADVKRTETGGKGLAGVVAREKEYVNPLLDVL